MTNARADLQEAVDRLHVDCRQARLVVASAEELLDLERAEAELAGARQQLDAPVSPFGPTDGELTARLALIRDRVTRYLGRGSAGERLQVDLRPVDVERSPSDVLGYDFASSLDSWRQSANAAEPRVGPICRYLDRRFHPDDGGRPKTPDQAYTDELIVAPTSSGSWRPVWLLPAGTPLPSAWEGSWSARLAACIDRGELIRVLRTLAPDQFETALETLPDAWIHDLTEEPWDTARANRVAEASLARFGKALERQGYALETVPGRRSAPLAIDELDLLDANPAVRDGLTAPITALGVAPAVEHALRTGGNLERPYIHQVLATAFLRRGLVDGTDLVLSTPTASGKTHAFLPAMLDVLHANRGKRTVVVLHPLKALSLDQAKKLRSINDLGLGLHIAEYFGNAKIDDLTGADGRLADVVLGTPDKLNYHLDKGEVQDVIRRAQFLVLDEAHVYRSHFGANMALFLRRLLSSAPRDLRIVVVSATLGNTVEFARTLTGRQRFRVVAASAAPVHGRFHYLPESDDETSSRRRRPSPTQVLRVVAKALQSERAHGITFVQSRPEAGTLARDLQPHAVPLVSGQRNYREIVEELQRGNGKASMVVATTTLEAGIDIGDLTTVALKGFPRNRNSFRQMAGRAGRTGPAHVVYFPGRHVTDAYYGRREHFGALIASLEADPVYLHPWNANLVVAHARRYQHETRAPRPMEADELRTWLGDPPTSSVDWSDLAHRLAQAAARGGAVAVPNLRGNMDLPYIVHTWRPTDQMPSPPAHATLKLGESGLPPEVIEQATTRIAYREWGIGNIALRGDRYFEVIEWTRGAIHDGHLRRDAIFVWVRDVTATMRVDPEVDPQLPPATHHTNTIEVALRMDVVHRTWGLESITGQAGFGEVSQALTGRRIHHELTWTFVCPRWRRSRGVKLVEAKQTPSFIDAKTRVEHESGSWEPLAGKDAKHGRARVSRTGDVIQELKVLDRLTSASKPVRWLAEVHEHAGSRQGTCSCGATTELRRGTLDAVEETPPSLGEHGVFKTHFDTINTDIALLALDDGSPRALAAVAKALAKVLPDVLSIDRDDVGTLARFVAGRLHLWFFDTIDGGAGLAPRIFDRASQLFTEAQRVLESSRMCSCAGAGCLGCFESSPQLVVREPRAIDQDDTEPPRDGTTERWLSSAGEAGLRYLEQLLSSWTQEEIADAALRPPDAAPDPASQEAATPADSRPATNTPAPAMPDASPEASSAAPVGPSDAGAAIFAMSERPYFQHVIVDVRLFDPLDATSGAVAEALLGAARLRLELVAPKAGAVSPPPRALSPALVQAWTGALTLDASHALEAAASQRGPVLIAVADLDVLPHGVDSIDGLTVALAAWGPDAANTAAWGPDLVLTRIADLVEAVNSPLAHSFPLEQAGRKVRRRSRPPRVSLNGFEAYALARYVPRTGSARGEDSDPLTSVSEHIDALLRSGTGANTAAMYLHEMWPSHAVATVATPAARSRSTRIAGLDMVTTGLQRRDHEITSVDSAHHCGVPVLLLDAIFDGSSRLPAVTQHLASEGVDVVPVALAYRPLRRQEPADQRAT